MRFVFLIGLTVLLSACTVKIKTSVQEFVEEPTISAPREKGKKKSAFVLQKKVEEPKNIQEEVLPLEDK